jgi:hypothetical protein
MDLGKIERVFVAEQNAVLPLPPTTPPLSSPFTIPLTGGGTIDPLATIRVNIRRNRNAVLLSAVVNWSATFTPPTTAAVLTTPGYVDVTFEILRNGIIVYTVTQTAVQKGTPLNQGLFTQAVPTFEIASLLHFDRPVVAEVPCINFRNGRDWSFVYTLRATNVALVAPLVAGETATVTAAVGAVTFVAEEIEEKN